MGKAGLMPRRKQSKARPKASKEDRQRRTPSPPLKPAPDYQQLLRETSLACRAKGFHPDDLDYAPVISAAVLRAVGDYDERKATGSLLRFCIHYALNRCRSAATSKRKAKERTGETPDQSDNLPTIGVGYLAIAREERQTTIDPADFELLSYVAAHGRVKACVDLGLDRATLHDTLLRIRAEIEKQAD